MSLVRRYLLSNCTYRGSNACSYLFNGTGANRVQYYTCLKDSHNQSRMFEYKGLEDHNRRNMAVSEYLKEKNYRVSSMLSVFTDKLLLFFSFGKGQYRELGFLWFKTLDDIIVEDFFDLFELPDTFHSRFQIIELHVWMLLCHLPSGNRNARLIRLGIIEAMWEDSRVRSNIICKNNTGVSKDLKNLYGEFLFAEVFYDYCFNKGDSCLASALWCSFFNKRDVSPRCIEALVSYVRYQMHHLSSLDFEKLHLTPKDANIWLPLRPHVEAIFARA